MTTGEFIARLWELFGAVGFASIAAWAAAVILLAAGARSPRRAGIYLAALVLATTGYVASKVNSAKVNTYREDPEEQKARLEAERRRQLAPDLPKEREGAAPVRFAEDGRYDRYDLAGAERGEKWLDERGEGKQDAKGDAEEDDVPYYTTRGKQEREAGKKRSEGAVVEGEGEASDLLPPPPGVPVEHEVVYLPENDVYLANRADMLNLNVAWAVLIVAAALVVLDYLRRFNSTDAQILPLPLAALPGPLPGLVDRLSPKAHVAWPANGGGEELKRRLERAVRKGESFILFGGADPGEEGALARLPFGLWPLSKVRCADVAGSRQAPSAGPSGVAEPGSEFVFESAWFGRYCFVVEGEAVSRRMLAELRRYLRARQATRARARATVNVAWDHDSPPADLLDELAFLCRETNFRWVGTRRPS